MNRKCNPWVSLVALVLLALILATTAGCAAPTEAAEDEAAAAWTRFDVEDYGPNCKIITDTETGVEYLVYWTTRGVGMTVLENGEG